MNVQVLGIDVLPEHENFIGSGFIACLPTIKHYEQAQKMFVTSVNSNDGLHSMLLYQMEEYNRRNNVSVANKWLLIASVPCKPCTLGIGAPGEIVLHLNHKGEFVTHFHNLQVGGCGNGGYFKNIGDAQSDFMKRVKKNC